MRLPALLTVTGLLWCLPALAAPTRVQEAKRLIDDLEVETALKVLDAAEKAEGNDRATLLEIYTLQGIAWGTLGKDAKTRDSFRKLLVLAPNAALPKDLPPRVRTPYFEAKEWAAANGPITAAPSAEVTAGQVVSVQVDVSKDVLRLARVVRFFQRLDGVVRSTDVVIAGGRAQSPVGRPAVSWWAEVLNDKKSVLFELGSAQSPRVDGQVEAAVVPGPPQEGVEGPVATTGTWRRPTGFVLLGGGVVAAGVGVILGVQAEAGRARLTTAPRDDAGRVTGLTQREAAALEVESRQQAVVANVLFGVGGAFAAVGLVFVVVGPATAPQLALSPAPGGVSVSGSF